MDKTQFASGILALGIALGGFFPGYYYYQSQRDNRTVTVKGLAELNVRANLAIWKIKFKTTGNDLAALQQKMVIDMQTIQNYLIQKGFKADEIIIGRMNTNDLMANQYRDAKAEDSRYILDQTITLRSENVDTVDVSMQGIGTLVSKGIIFDNPDYSSPVSYLFTGLNQIKPSMLKEATQNARQAADEFAHDSNSKVGKIRSANQGVFSILPREEIPDQSEREQINKKVRVVSTVEYYLE